jgi:hypothetical protein
VGRGDLRCLVSISSLASFASTGSNSIQGQECGLTLPSSGRPRAGRAMLVRHFPLRAASPRPPLMSNVRPRDRIRGCAVRSISRSARCRGCLLVCCAGESKVPRLSAASWPSERFASRGSRRIVRRGLSALCRSAHRRGVPVAFRGSKHFESSPRRSCAPGKASNASFLHESRRFSYSRSHALPICLK